MFNKSGKQKSKKSSTEIKCPKCNKMVSNEVVQKAEEKSRKKIEESMKRTGTINVNVKWEVKCDHCGSKISY